LITDIHQNDAVILDEKFERDATRQVEGYRGEDAHFSTQYMQTQG